MSSIYGNHNQYDGRRRPTKKTSYSAGDTRLHIMATAAIVNLVMSAVMVALSYLLISSPDSREIYTKFLFIPVAAFAGAFISFLLHKELVINAACNAASLSADASYFCGFFLLGAFMAGFLSA